MGEEFFLDIVLPVIEEGGVVVVASPSITVVGRTRVDAAVSVNDLFPAVDEDGRFEVTFELEDIIEVEVVASIGTGEVLTATFTVSFEPEEGT